MNLTDGDVIWQRVLDEVKAEASLTAIACKQWLLPMKPLTYQEGTLTVGVPSAFHKEWVEKRYFSFLRQAIKLAWPQKLQLVLVVREEKDLPLKIITPPPAIPSRKKTVPMEKRPCSTPKIMPSSQNAKSSRLSPRTRETPIERIRNAVAMYFHLEIAELCGKRRLRRIAFPRQIAMYLCRELTQGSFPQIGYAFGGRDHTTVMHAHHKISLERMHSQTLAKDLEELTHCLAQVP